MYQSEKMPRRDFLIKSAFASTTLPLALSSHTVTSSQSQSRIKLGIFTKHLQWLNYEDTADAVAEIGWNGIECSILSGGHVLPERVEEDLPQMVEALKKRNLEILLASTRIQDISEPYAETVLRTIANLGIKYYRIGSWKYNDKVSVPDQLKEIKAQLKDLVALNKELGICAAFHNHSGSRVGAPVWDIYELIKGFANKYIGAAFDIGHATVEGGYAWPIHFRLMQPFLKSVIVKDFRWEKKGGPWKIHWVPLGQGMVNKEFFSMLAESGYCGSLIQHFELKVEGNTKKEKHKNLIKIMKRDCATLKTWLREANLM